jgi:hypothetical protein
MYEYKIIKTERWWIISRKKEMWRLLLLQFLNSYYLWTPNKWGAKVFYTKDSAADALITMKIKDKKKSDE